MIRLFGKAAVWIIKAAALLLLTFIILIALDYFGASWLTDKTAYAVLLSVFLLYCLSGVIRKPKTRKPRFENRGERNIEEYSSDQRHRRSYRYEKKDAGKVRKKRTGKAWMMLPVAVISIMIAFLYVRSTNTVDPAVPEEVIEFGRKYPEAAEYVDNFARYKNTDFDMDVTEEMAEKEIPLFIQWDKRWGYRDYGGNYIGVAGCGPTCLSMVACGLKKDPNITPYEVSTYSAAQGFYTYGQGTSWNIMTEGARHYGLQASSGTVSSDYILNNLSEKTPMICSMAPGDFTYTGHFIVLTGIDEDGRIMVNDPNSLKNSKKRWDVDTLVSQMKSVWRYSYN